MIILSVNAGSSSLKFSLFEMPEGVELVNGYFEKIGLSDSFYSIKVNGEKIIRDKRVDTHKKAVEYLCEELIENGIINSMDEIKGIGHRVVHAGEYYSDSVVIDDEVLDHVTELTKLVPIHHPGEIAGIKAMQEKMPGVVNVAVFDTAFHQTMPKEAYMYALPYSYYEDYGIRRYGFHGTSHKYVAQRCAELMGKHMTDLRIITCHLGNGSSVAAIKGGRSIDTTMGFTPLSGLIMGTRTGDIDPAIVPFLMEKTGMTYEEIDRVMNKESGVLGISGVSNDFRVIEEAASNGNKRAQLALNMFHYKVRRVIGAFAAVMGGVDAIVFTAGIGENGIGNRDAICNGLEYLGTRIDSERNNIRGKEQEISAEGSKVKIFVIPTNEEIMIARDTQRITSALKK